MIEEILKNILDELRLIKETMNKNIQTESTQNPKNRLLKVKDWKKYHDWPPEGGLRWIIFQHGGKEVKDSFVVRIGRTVLIDEEKFFEWVKKNPKLHNWKETNEL